MSFRSFFAFAVIVLFAASFCHADTVKLEFTGVLVDNPNALLSDNSLNLTAFNLTIFLDSDAPDLDASPGSGYYALGAGSSLTIDGVSRTLYPGAALQIIDSFSGADIALSGSFDVNGTPFSLVFFFTDSSWSGTGPADINPAASLALGYSNWTEPASHLVVDYAGSKQIISAPEPGTSQLLSLSILLLFGLGMVSPGSRRLIRRMQP